MPKILVAEDDPALRELYATVFRRAGYEVAVAADGDQALDLAGEDVDLIVSDVRMPGCSGLALTAQLREAGVNTPLILITALGTSRDKELGFRAGSDDYMVKPVELEELLWRAEALLRRSGRLTRSVTVGSTRLDCGDLCVIRDGRAEKLPKKEFALLLKLCSSLGRTFTQEQLLDDVWGADGDTDPQTLYVHIGRLRERFADNPDFEIRTIRGLGYKAVRK